jgi:hypothetical protein
VTASTPAHFSGELLVQMDKRPIINHARLRIPFETVGYVASFQNGDDNLRDHREPPATNEYFVVPGRGRQPKWSENRVAILLFGSQNAMQMHCTE